MSPPGVDLGPHRDPPGDAVEPGPQHVALADRPGLLDQDQERRLEGIGDVVRIVQDAPADAQHHRPVPMEDRLERRLVAMGEESLQELGLAQARDGPRVEETFQRIDDRTAMSFRHASGPPPEPRRCRFLYEYTDAGDRSQFFLEISTQPSVGPTIGSEGDRSRAFRDHGPGITNAVSAREHESWRGPG